MSEFRVWAPNAQRMQVRLANYIHEMESLPGGWWLANAPEAPVGADYSFIVDGGDPLPDPRTFLCMSLVGPCVLLYFVFRTSRSTNIHRTRGDRN